MYGNHQVKSLKSVQFITVAHPSLYLTTRFRVLHPSREKVKWSSNLEQKQGFKGQSAKADYFPLLLSMSWHLKFILGTPSGGLTQRLDTTHTYPVYFCAPQVGKINLWECLIVTNEHLSYNRMSLSDPHLLSSQDPSAALPNISTDRSY